jgi:hypothetical protein
MKIVKQNGNTPMISGLLPTLSHENVSNVFGFLSNDAKHQVLKTGM